MSGFAGKRGNQGVSGLGGEKGVFGISGESGPKGLTGKSGEKGESAFLPCVIWTTPHQHCQLTISIFPPSSTR